jgi:glycosyltransferase involved in cell wall biosynthesis
MKPYAMSTNLNESHIVMISGDRNALVKGSAVFSRLQSYATLVAKLDVVVACDLKEEWVEGNLRIIGTGGAKGVRHWRAYRIASLILDADIVTAQDPFEHGLVAQRVVRKTGARLHIQCHTDPYSSHFADASFLNRLRRPLARYVLARADAVRAVSDRIARSIRQHARADVSVIPIPLEFSDSAEPARLPFEETIVTIGRLESEKNIETCIWAIAQLRKTRPQAGLLILGSGSQRKKLEEVMRELHVSDGVRFAGHVPHESVPSYLLGAKAYLQASSYEGYGLSLLTAAMAKVPIVTTDVGLVGEVLVQDQSCLVFPQGDFDAAARLLDTVLSDTERSERLSSAAYEAALRSRESDGEYPARIVADWKRAFTPASRRVLIITQVMDRNHPVLGFFVRWVEAIAHEADAVTVICLQKGENIGLPESVRVLSLGKEEGTTKLQRIKRLFSYVWEYRRDYDSVLVHMNQEYILLCGWLWKLLGKRVAMWRNHHEGTMLTRLAGWMCDVVYCPSRFSFTADFPNVHHMPVGIDTSLFNAEGATERKQYSVLSVGRIDRSKNLEMLLEAFARVVRQIPEASLDIVGAPTESTSVYPEILRVLAATLGIGASVRFLGPIRNEDMPDTYRKYEVFVNCSSSGMFDKTIFESMACGEVVVASNENLRGHYDERFIVTQADVPGLAQSMMQALRLDAAERARIVEQGEALVRGKHSLLSLVGAFNRSLYKHAKVDRPGRQG